MQIETKWLEEFTNRINKRLGKYHASPNRIDINVPRDGMLPIVRGKTAELLMPFTSLKETIFKPGDFFKLTAATLDRIAELYAVPPEIVPAHVNAAWKRYRNELFCQAGQ